MFDQHFMVDKEIIGKLAGLAELCKKDVVLEIGSGSGNLTSELKKHCKVVTVEIDPNFEADIKGNVLEIELPKFDKIVSNLAYSICEPLLWKLVRTDFKLACLTVPKTFYEKLISGSKLNLLCENCFNVELGFDVPRSAFEPEPKTDSCVILLKPKKGKFRWIFEQYDKKLKNCLMKKFTDEGMTKNSARQKLLETGILFSALEEKISHLSLEKLKIVIEKLKS